MQAAIELKQYASELAVQNIPTIEVLMQKELQGINDYILNATVPKERESLVRKQLLLDELRQQAASFANFATEEQLEAKIAELEEKVLVQQNQDPQFSSVLFQYNRPQGVQASTYASDIYQEEKRICTSAYCSQICSSIQELVNSNDSICGQIAKLAENFQKFDFSDAAEQQENTEISFVAPEFAESSVVRDSMARGYQRHAQLLMQRKELLGQRAMLQEAEQQSLKHSIQEIQAQIADYTQEDQALLYQKLSSAYRAANSFLQEKLLVLQDNTQDDDAVQVEKCKQKCDLTLQNIASVFEQLKALSKSANIQIAQLQGALQSEIQQNVVLIKSKLQDLQQIIRNYLLIDSVNFGQLIALNTGKYSCRADEMELREIAQCNIKSCSAISEIGNQCVDYLSGLIEDDYQVAQEAFYSNQLSNLLHFYTDNEIIDPGEQEFELQQQIADIQERIQNILLK